MSFANFRRIDYETFRANTKVVEMSSTVEHTFSKFMEKKRPKRTRKYGQSGPEMTISEEIFEFLPNDVQEAMSTLTTEKKALPIPGYFQTSGFLRSLCVTFRLRFIIVLFP